MKIENDFIGEVSYLAWVTETAEFPSRSQAERWDPR